MKKIFISTSSFGEFDKFGIQRCSREGFILSFNSHKRTLTGNELLTLAKDSVGLIAGTEEINADTLSKLKKLKVISRCGAGTNNIDLEAAKKLGIKICSTPDAPTLAVAELTLALILTLLRKVLPMDSAIRQNKWKKLMGNLLSGKKIGIIGFGRIGRKVAQLLNSFNCEIAVYDLFLKRRNMGFRYSSKNRLLKWADIITIHASGTTPIIGRNELKIMKKGSWLINVSRGGLVVEAELIKCLNNGHLSGAALDVFEKEPYSGPLRKCGNVILTPHIGSYARESRIRMENEAVDNLLAALKEEH